MWTSSHSTRNVHREVHPLPKVDDICILAQLTGAKRFSKLDANSGFWQIPLAEESQPLTTFITPFGRYCFNKMPFGISSAPEHFQKRLSRIMTGLEGILCLMDDVLVFGKNNEQHNERLAQVMERIQKAGVTLNPSKCEFGKTQLKFLGYLVDLDGIRADPEKTSAITEMTTPSNISELRRFMGMINQLGKFSPNIADLMHTAITTTCLKEICVAMGTSSRAAVKKELTKPTVMTPKHKPKYVQMSHHTDLELF